MYDRGGLLTLATKQHLEIRQCNGSDTGDGETNTTVMRLATRAATPATMMTARANLSPVPPGDRSEGPPMAWRLPGADMVEVRRRDKERQEKVLEAERERTAPGRVSRFQRTKRAIMRRRSWTLLWSCAAEERSLDGPSPGLIAEGARATRDAHLPSMRLVTAPRTRCPASFH